MDFGGKEDYSCFHTFLLCTGTLLSFGVLLVYYLTNEGRFFHAVRVLFYCSDLVVSRGLGENEKE